MKPTVLVTGATGNAGVAVIRCLLEAGWSVLALVRPGRLETLVNRLRLPVVPANLELVSGDVTLPFCGLNPNQFTASHIVHCAANVAWDARPSELYRANVDGVRQVLALARRIKNRCEVKGVILLSTAYVGGGDVGGIAALGKMTATFNNPYEASKFLAERLIGTARDLPVRIVRPSTIVGDSRDGAIQNYTGLYFPLKLLADKPLRWFPGAPDALLDFVPADHLAEVIFTLLQADSPSQVTQVCAGDRAVTLAEVWRSACESLNAIDPRVPMRRPGYFLPLSILGWMAAVAKPFLTTRQRRLVSNLKLYRPYLSKSEDLHSDAPPPAHDLTALLTVLYRHALATGFGRDSTLRAS